jgi:transcriptional regulator with XRE-family HTH domain
MPAARTQGKNAGRNTVGGLSSRNVIDVHIGLRIRQLRTVIGLTQQMLGAAAGLSRQHVQIYETGAYSVPVSRLFELAIALNVSPSFFFEGPRFSRKALLHRERP